MGIVLTVIRAWSVGRRNDQQLWKARQYICISYPDLLLCSQTVHVDRSRKGNIYKPKKERTM